MEQKILLDSCDFNPVVNSGRYISLLDKNELTKDDLHWLELLPFIRILGIIPYTYTIGYKKLNFF